MQPGDFRARLIKPITLKLVWEVAKAVKIPVLGWGA